VSDSPDLEIPESNQVLSRPTLLVTGSRNFISSAAEFAKQMKPYVTEFEARELYSGHWVQLEKSDELNVILREFFDGNPI
jgi:pimeloyl-ACP methyl ester carboxylesterase